MCKSDSLQILPLTDNGALRTDRGLNRPKVRLLEHTDTNQIIKILKYTVQEDATSTPQEITEVVAS